MAGGKASVMAGIHRLQHIQCLFTADLPHHNAVRPHSQGSLDQVTDCYFNGFLRIGFFCLHAYQVRYILDLQLCGILYGNHAFPGRNKIGNSVEKSGFSAARAAAHKYIVP